MGALLICDSDVARRESYRAGLEALGHVVIAAPSSVSAIDRLREGGIDAVIVDHGVAGGVATLHDVLQRLPDPPPFVLLSNAVDAPALSARLGAAAFVPYPCTAEDLAAVIARVVTPRNVPTELEDHPTRPFERGD